MNYRRSQLIIRIILSIIPVLVLGGLVYQNFSFSGQLSAVYDFKKPSAFITNLWPPNRVSEIVKENGVYYQAIQFDPVSFVIKVPRESFRTMTIELKYKKPVEIPLAVGIKDMTSEWRYNLQAVPPGFVEDGWQISIVKFDLTDFNYQDNKIQALFSSPYLQETDQQILISEIKVLLEKKPITFSDFWPRFINFMKNL